MNDSRMSGLGASPSQYFARQRIESLVNVPRLFAAIDADPGIVGAGVVYIDADYNVVTLREFRPICSVLTKRVVLQEVKRYLTPEQYVDQAMRTPRESRVWWEAAGAAPACIGLIISAVVILKGGMMTMFTGPLGLMVSAAGISSIVATGLQCGIGLHRVYQEVVNPELNDLLDQQGWYRTAVPILDVVSLLGVVSNALNTVRFLLVRKAATGVNWYEITRTLSLQQRKALTTELLLITHPSLTAKQLKLAQHMGTIQKRYTPTELKHSTTAMIRDSISGALGVAGSSNIQTIALSLFEEPEQ
ncbi:MAG: NAD synthetase [Pseudomonas sp.]|uniref:NAD synthetase n=1 Tax=Pseudomonas sp. TaxID=306 RepID=UPI003D0BFA9D